MSCCVAHEWMKCFRITHHPDVHKTNVLYKYTVNFVIVN